MELPVRIGQIFSKFPYTAGRNFSIHSSPCVLSPFFFVTWSGSGSNEEGSLNCSFSNCTFTNCCTIEDNALLIRIPAAMPMPVRDEERVPVVLHQQRRDFGITTAMVAIIAISVTAATAAGIVLSQTVQMAETVNQLAEGVSNALDIQNDLNGHIQLGILTLNQQVALVQEQVDYLWTFQPLTCSSFYHVICVTPGTVLHASATVMKLNRCMRGIWNITFVNFTTQLVHAI